MNTDVESDFPGKNILKLQYVSPHEMEAFRRFCRLSREELIRYLTDKCNVYLDGDSNDRKEIVLAKLESFKKDTIFSGEEQEFFPVFVPQERVFLLKVFFKRKIRLQNRKDFRAMQEREKKLRDNGVFDRIDAWKKTLPENYTFLPSDLLRFLPEKVVEHFRNHLKQHGIELNELLLRKIGSFFYDSKIRLQEWGLACECADCASFEGDYQTIWYYAYERKGMFGDSE